MSTVYLRRSDSTVDAIIRATFPAYTGQNIRAIITDNVHFYGTQWDGGMRRSYRILRLSDMAQIPIPVAPFMRESNLHECNYALNPDVVVVVYNEGYRESIEIHACSQTITPMLGAPTDLTDDERIVLKYTKSLKSSYGGIKNFRFVEANRETGIDAARWDDAKASLIARKFLNRAGAITIEGKNAL